MNENNQPSESSHSLSSSKEHLSSSNLTDLDKQRIREKSEEYAESFKTGEWFENIRIDAGIYVGEYATEYERAKQAELVAENARLKAECSSHEKERYEIYSFDSSQAMEIKALQKELEQLRSERDKMREALEASKIALEILEQVHDEFLPHTIVKFKKAKKLYESALSGGSK